MHSHYFFTKNLGQWQRKTFFEFFFEVIIVPFCEEGENFSDSALTWAKDRLKSREPTSPPTPHPALEYIDFVALPWQEHSQSERSHLSQPLWAPGCVKCLVSRRHRVGGGAAGEFRSGVTPEGRRGCCQCTCPVLPGSLIISAVENCFLPEDAKHWLHYGVNWRGD